MRLLVRGGFLGCALVLLGACPWAASYFGHIVPALMLLAIVGISVGILMNRTPMVFFSDESEEGEGDDNVT